MNRRISRRLTTLAYMVTPGSRVCDVGCDHCILSIYLVREKICPKVIAMDLRSGPLSRGKEHIAGHGLEHYIDTRISDGLDELKDGEADTLICAGMGGRLLMRILEEGKAKAQRCKELILQPQSDVTFFRKYLREEGYRTISEDMIQEEGKFYPMMKVVPIGEPISCSEPLYDMFGELLLKEGNPVLERYLKVRRNVVGEIIEKLSVELSFKNEGGFVESLSYRRSLRRKQELVEELSEINRALSWFFEKKDK